MKKPLFLIFGLLLAALFYYAFLASDTASDPASKSPASAVPKPKFALEGNTPKLKPDQSMGDWSPEDFASLEAHFKQPGNKRSLSMDATLKDGETLMTDCYQTPDGLYVYAGITASIVQDANGKPSAQFTVKSMRADFLGGVNTLGTSSFTVGEKETRIINSITTGWSHQLAVSGSVDSSRNIRLKASGSAERTNKLLNKK